VIFGAFFTMKCVNKKVLLRCPMPSRRQLACAEFTTSGGSVNLGHTFRADLDVAHVLFHLLALELANTAHDPEHGQGDEKEVDDGLDELSNILCATWHVREKEGVYTAPSARASAGV
jgi:hypothetical protein